MRMTLPSILTTEGRKAWAFAAIVGGCVVFTVFAAVGVYLVRGSAWFAFWLALAAHGQILVGMGALAYVLGARRNIKVSKDSFEIEDQAEAAQTVADAAQDRANEVKS